MVAAFLDSWLTGDPDEASVIMEFDRPSRPELASVIGLAARLYLGGAGAPRRCFAWGQAVRGAVLAVMLAHAVWGLSEFELLARSRHLIGWLPPPPAVGGIWPTVSYLVGYAWLMTFLALVLGHCRVARVMAVLAIAAYLAAVLQAQLARTLASPFASWTYWIFIDLVPVWPWPRSIATHRRPRAGLCCLVLAVVCLATRCGPGPARPARACGR